MLVVSCAAACVGDAGGACAAHGGAKTLGKGCPCGPAQERPERRWEQRRHDVDWTPLACYGTFSRGGGGSPRGGHVLCSQKRLDMVYTPIGKRVLETCKRQPSLYIDTCQHHRPNSDGQWTNTTSGRWTPCGFASFFFTAFFPFLFPLFCAGQAQKAAAEKKAWRLQLFKGRRRHPCAISGTQSCSEAREEETGRRAFNPLINDPMQVQTGSAAWRGSQETSDNKPKTCQVLHGNQQFFCWNID